MAINAEKIKYVKNVTNTEGDELVYMEHFIGDEFDLAFKNRPHSGKKGEQILLVQQRKLTHVVEIVNDQIQSVSQKKSTHPHTMRVRTVAIIPDGIRKTVTSICDLLNFRGSLRGGNLVKIKTLTFPSKNMRVLKIQRRIFEIFKELGEIK